jgi:ABC-type glutathione transport system ATPase component
VRSVNLELAPGDRLALVGESGSGKTTTILAMLGLLPATALVGGKVLLDGKNVVEDGERSVRPHRWTDVAMVFQGAMNALNPVRRIGWQLCEPMRVHGIARGRAALDRARELLSRVGLAPEIADRYPHELSGGQRQRAVIALALACEPRVLLADEPTTALDVLVQAQVLDLLRELSDTLGLALVMVTHDLHAAARVCTRMAVMHEGAIVEQGDCRRILTAPEDPYTRRLVAATPVLRTAR